MLRILRKKHKINNEELDAFLGSKSTSTKYYLEKTFSTQKIIKYLVFLRMNGININSLFDKEIEKHHKDYKKWKKQ